MRVYFEDAIEILNDPKHPYLTSSLSERLRIFIGLFWGLVLNNLKLFQKPHANANNDTWKAANLKFSFAFSIH